MLPSRPARRARLLRAIALASLLLVVPVLASAQPAPRPDDPAPPLRRWLDVQQVQLGLRLRSTEATGDTAWTRSLQWQPQIRARLLVDRNARVALHLGAFSGGTFISGWNNTGLGTGEFAGDFNVKQLFLAVAPTTAVEAQVGSLYLLRGEGTEVTTYDNDGFLDGERVSWAPRGDVQVTATAGYLGDLTDPNALHRLKRLDRWNYGQALVSWRMAGRVSASADYTYDTGRDILHEAMTVRMPTGTPLLAAVRLDAYERLSPDGAAGVNASADLVPLSRLRITAGAETVDRSYGPVNGDRYVVGPHVYTTGTLALTRDLSVGWFHEEAVGHHRPLVNERRLELMATFNPTATLRRAHVF